MKSKQHRRVYLYTLQDHATGEVFFVTSEESKAASTLVQDSTRRNGKQLLSLNDAVNHIVATKQAQREANNDL